MYWLWGVWDTAVKLILEILQKIYLWNKLSVLITASNSLFEKVGLVINQWWLIEASLLWMNCLPSCCVKPVLCVLTDKRDPALALATDSFSFSAARRWTAWKLLRAAEKSFISRSLWSFCCLWPPQSRGGGSADVWDKSETRHLESQNGLHFRFILLHHGSNVF